MQETGPQNQKDDKIFQSARANRVEASREEHRGTERSRSP